jgi:hypothetical protein
MLNMSLEHYTEMVRRRGDKQYLPVYVTLSQILEPLSTL